MTLVETLRTLFVRQRAVFLAVFLAASTAAVITTLFLPEKYRATAMLLVGTDRPISTGVNTVPLDAVLSRTYAELLSTGSVAREVARQLPPDADARRLPRKMSFEVVTGTNLVKVTATESTPEAAQRLANVYLETFVQMQQVSAGRASQATLERLAVRIGDLAKEVQSLESRAGTPVPPGRLARWTRANAELDAAREAHTSMQENVTLHGNDISAASTAALPTVPSEPTPLKYGAIGIVFAAILAAVVALVRDPFDQRVRDEDDLVEIAAAPILARVPAPGGSFSEQRFFDESFQFLRSNLEVERGAEGCLLIVVTSSTSEDDKSLVVYNLARALAAGGARVVAVDCDLRRPTLSRHFGFENARGVSEALLGIGDLNSLAKQTSHAGVRLLSPGALPPNPSAFLRENNAAEALHSLRDHAEYVLVEMPPVTVGAETSLLAGIADGVLLVVDQPRARRDVLLAVAEQLSRARPRVLGIVLNHASGATQSYQSFDRHDSIGPLVNRQRAKNGAGERGRAAV